MEAFISHLVSHVHTVRITRANNDFRLRPQEESESWALAWLLGVSLIFLFLFSSSFKIRIIKSKVGTIDISLFHDDTCLLGHAIEH